VEGSAKAYVTSSGVVKSWMSTVLYRMGEAIVLKVEETRAS
jgi:hypothetical protein